MQWLVKYGTWMLYSCTSLCLSNVISAWNVSKRSLSASNIQYPPLSFIHAYYMLNLCILQERVKFHLKMLWLVGFTKKQNYVPTTKIKGRVRHVKYHQFLSKENFLSTGRKYLLWFLHAVMVLPWIAGFALVRASRDWQWAITFCSLFPWELIIVLLFLLTVFRWEVIIVLLFLSIMLW